MKQKKSAPYLHFPITVNLSDITRIQTNLQGILRRLLPNLTPKKDYL